MRSLANHSGSGSGRVGIFIQARANSSRLPGKIFELLQPGRPDSSILETIYRRMSGVSGARTVVLVPENEAALIDWCRRRDMECFAGPEVDVRERYRRAARYYDVDYVVRATGDNPCVDPEVTADTARALVAGGADLLSYGNLPLGAAVESMRREALESDQAPACEVHREHVSLHIKHNPERFRVEHPDHPSAPAKGRVALPRLTVDTAEDLAVVRAVFAALGADFRTPGVIQLFEQRPEIFALNRDVPQRSFTPLLQA
ncbi:MAG: hypothetical protein RIF32_24230 [Leptospirales bacterium]|jgi:spore coat polysaccharide biosynthesis protein SpsF